MKLVKDYKINVTSYLTIATVDALDALAKEENSSRNSIVERAVLSFIDKAGKNKNLPSYN